METPFRKTPGGARTGPLVNVTIRGIVGTDATFEARLDTGADLTVIPKKYLRLLRPNPDGAVNIKLADGEIRREKTYSVSILITDKCIYLDPVMTTTSDVGLLGIDILTHFDIALIGGVMIIDPRQRRQTEVTYTLTLRDATWWLSDSDNEGSEKMIGHAMECQLLRDGDNVLLAAGAIGCEDVIVPSDTAVEGFGRSRDGKALWELTDTGGIYNGALRLTNPIRR